jgi:hypothetical protein
MRASGQGKLFLRAIVLFVLAVSTLQTAVADELQFSRIGRYIVVPIKIDGHPAFGAIETSADSTLDAGFAEKIGLGSMWKDSAKGTNGGKTRNDLSVATLITIGDVVSEKRQIVLRPGGAPLASEDDGPAVMALIGFDVLKNYVVEINFDRSTIAFSRAGEFKAFPREGALTLKESNGARAIRVKLDGKNADALISISSSPAAYLSGPFAAKSKLIVGKRVSETLVTDTVGTFRRPVASLETLKIGNHTLNDVPVSISAGSLWDAEVVLGLPVLSQFNLILDFSRYRMWMTPNGNFGHVEYPRDRLGLRFMPDESPRRIRLVAPGSPAEKAGFKLGEIVLEMRGQDGAPVESGSVKAGTTVTVVMGDGSERKIVAENYY